MDLEDKKVVCKVCLTQFARYICPRCNITYCSLACYKQHNGTCTESFSREQAVQQLKGTRVDDEHKKGLLAVLKRAQRQADKDTRLFERAQGLGGGDGGSSSSDDGGDSSEVSGSGDDDEDEEEEEEDVSHSGSQESDDDDEEDAGLIGSHAKGSSHAGTSSTAGRSQPARTSGHISNGHGEGLSHNQDTGSAIQGTVQTAGGVNVSDRPRLSASTMKRLMRKLRKTDLESLSIDESDLTQAELQAFHRALAAGRVSHLLPEWQPWWLTPEARTLTLSATGQPLVQPINPPSSTARNHQPKPKGTSSTPQQVLPAPPSQPLQPITDLTKVPPSPLLRWQAVELLYAYCFVQRRYNGEACHPEHVDEAAAEVLALCPVLAMSTLGMRHPSQPGTARSTTSTNGGTDEDVGMSKVTSKVTSELTNQSAATATSPPAQLSASSLPGSTCSTSQSMVQNGQVNRPAASAGGGGQMPVAGLPPASAADAVFRCVSAVCQPPLGDMTCRPMALGVLSDVAAVCQAGVSCMVLALIDLHRLLCQALAPSSDSHLGHSQQTLDTTQVQRAFGAAQHHRAQGKSQTSTGSKRQLKAAAAKVLFTSCWVQDQSVAPLSVSLADELAGALHAQLHELAVQQQTTGLHAQGAAKVVTH